MTDDRTTYRSHVVIVYPSGMANIHNPPPVPTVEWGEFLCSQPSLIAAKAWIDAKMESSDAL